jgi:hypothetical protein
MTPSVSHTTEQFKTAREQKKSRRGHIFVTGHHRHVVKTDEEFDISKTKKKNKKRQ